MDLGFRVQFRAWSQRSEVVAIGRQRGLVSRLIIEIIGVIICRIGVTNQLT